MSTTVRSPVPASAVVVGCGLIGGSLASALRAKAIHVTVVDRPDVLVRVRERRLADRCRAPSELGAALRDDPPDVVVLATSVDVILDLLPDVHEAVRDLPRAAAPMVLDVGSVKGPIVARADALGLRRFIGGHPMAGRERGGIEHADAGLFRGSRFVLCPSAGADDDDWRCAEAIARCCGAQPIRVEARVHDRCAAMMSHLPHLAAWSLMRAGEDLAGELAGDSPAGDLPWSMAAGSWRDATRVAAASPSLWEEIIGSNRTAVLGALDRWIEVMVALRASVSEQATGSILGGIDAERLSHLRRELDPQLPPVRDPPRKPTEE